MPLVQSLVHAFAPWQSLYSDSKIIAATVNAVHLTGLLFSGGLAVAADRTTLRALKGRPSALTRALVELGDRGPLVAVGGAVRIDLQQRVAAARVIDDPHQGLGIGTTHTLTVTKQDDPAAQGLDIMRGLAAPLSLQGGSFTAAGTCRAILAAFS